METLEYESEGIDLADAFNDLMRGAAVLADGRLNDAERRVQERVTNTLLGNIPLENLPRLPATTMGLLARVNDPEVSADEVLGLINRDAALSAELLRLANSAYFRRGREVCNPKQALVTVGFNGLKAMVVNLLLKPVIQIKPIYFKMFGQQLWDHSQDCAVACMRLSTGQKADSFNAYQLGLIHDVGKIVIFQRLVEAFSAVDPGVEPRPHVFVKLITRHAMPLSHLVAQSWEFPRIYLDALRAQAQGEMPDEMAELSRTLYFANLLTESYSLMRRRRFPPDRIERFLKGFGMNLELITQVFAGDN